MSVFESQENLYSVLGGFFEALAKDESIAPKLHASKLKLRFNYKNPDGCIFIDFAGDDIVIKCGDATSTVDVEMNMKAETAHKFWLGKVNLPVALARREITAKGPIPKILKLLPIIKPAYKAYPDYLKSIGKAA